jgi:hypothetical protein
MKSYARSAPGALAIMLLSACLDLTPTIVPEEVSEAGRKTSEECLACLNAPSAPGPGCGESLAACQAFPACGRGVECQVREGCFSGTTEEFPICSRRCAELAGVRSTDDPSTKPGLEFYECTLEKCGTKCFTDHADGGPGPDGGTAETGPADGAADSSGSACTNAADQAVLESPAFSSAPSGCGLMCFGSDADCNARCMEEKGLSGACARCWGDTINCGEQNCLVPCLSPDSPECRACTAEHCDPAFHACSGT